MRRNLCLGWGTQAGILLCKCIDNRAFPFLSEGVRKPTWDLRGDELNDKQRYLLAKLALDDEKMPLALLTEDDPDPWKIAETPEEDPATYKARIEAADAMTDEEAEQMHERWRKRAAYQAANPQKHASDRGDHIYLLTWLAAIRWDLAPEHPERLRSDLQQVFHPWVDTFKIPPGKTVTHTPLPAGEIGNDHVVHILRAHAEIQADACDLLAEVLESEERILAGQAEAADTAAPAVATGTTENETMVTAKPRSDAVAEEPAEDQTEAGNATPTEATSIAVQSEPNLPTTPEDEDTKRDPPGGEWVGPMSRAEIAKRISGDSNARWRKVASLFKAGYVQGVSPHLIRVRVDHLDGPTREKLKKNP